jgi:hypothetical protein
VDTACGWFAGVGRAWILIITGGADVLPACTASVLRAGFVGCTRIPIIASGAGIDFTQTSRFIITGVENTWVAFSTVKGGTFALSYRTRVVPSAGFSVITWRRVGDLGTALNHIASIVGAGIVIIAKLDQRCVLTADQRVTCIECTCISVRAIQGYADTYALGACPAITAYAAIITGG